MERKTDKETGRKKEKIEIGKQAKKITIREERPFQLCQQTAKLRMTNRVTRQAERRGYGHCKSGLEA